jgi:hypothetical protein
MMPTTPRCFKITQYRDGGESTGCVAQAFAVLMSGMMDEHSPECASVSCLHFYQRAPSVLATGNISVVYIFADIGYKRPKSAVRVPFL